MSEKPPLTLYLAAPRGFCAGVDRAIKIVEMALEKWGAPVYVRHEIVHNKFVVDDLRAKGAVFVEELDECPTDRPVIFSAHGVPKAVPAEAERRQMLYVDATCPLVSKVHIEAERHHERGYQIIMIGHEGHPETVGTMGQLPEGEVILVGTNGSYRYPRIPGVWRLHPDQFGRGLQIVEMRFIPPGKTPLAIYPAVQQNPNYLYDLVPSSAVPGYNVET
ncbi:MAG: hypothetical protein AAFV62_11070, partial [Pseudomonadota bacterium]